MTLADWDKDAEQATPEQLKERAAAIELLITTWPAFKTAFGWTGIATVGQTQYFELVKREKTQR